MESRDLIVTPLFLIFIYVTAYFVRYIVADRTVRKYFIPALTLKIFGAISLGFIYQYYYKGGDTFVYFHQGSRYIWEAFLDSPLKALKLIFAKGDYLPETLEYASKIIFYDDLPSYFVVRVAGLFDILTFHTYSATACLFAVASFSGLWAMYTAFYRMFPKLHMELAIAIFFIPSVFFWGSGILKDSITLGALGWATYAFYCIFIRKRNLILPLLILTLSFLIIYEIKIYILLCFVPALLIWLYLHYMSRVRNLVLKTMVFPVSLLILVGSGYLAVKRIGEENRRYNLGNITQTAEATARWLTYVSAREEGSAYSLGDFDYSASGILKKTVPAIWVTLFRPYFWEAKNPVMALSALESFLLFGFFLFVLLMVFRRGNLSKIFEQPVIAFCFFFTITFSFAVGISTYNFGSLVRYKIPMMPFFLIGLLLLLAYSKRRRKLARFDRNENLSSTSFLPDDPIRVRRAGS
jgi:hypothetical protein